MDTTTKLKQHEQKIAQISASLEALKASNDIDVIQARIDELLTELIAELQQAERTIMDLNPIKSRLLVTPEARQLSSIRGLRKKIYNLQEM